MSTPVILLIIAGWLIAVGLFRWFVVRRLARGPGGDAVKGLIWVTARAYLRLVHRARYTGLEHVPATNQPGGLVVVSNHTGPIDALLIQAACRFQIRWMMASEMMVPQLDWLWRVYRVIAVARDGSDTGPAREAIRHVREGGVVGIFPEGGIENPPGEIRPFLAGVGLVVARAKAPVLLAWVSGTPECPEMLPALTTPSRARLQFIDVIDFGDERDALVITDRLRSRIAEASGWPTNDEPLIRPRLEPDPFAA